MKITTTIPQKEYPYLAVWIGVGQLLDQDIKKIKIQDIVLISLVEAEEHEDKKVHVQFVLGNKKAYITINEQDYYPLPKGYILEFCQ